MIVRGQELIPILAFKAGEEQLIIIRFLQKMKEVRQYDLIIVGAGCVGMAMAYQARKEGKTCLVIEKQKIGDESRYWSSSFSARQTRIQYTESYLTNFVLQSNKYWEEIEDEAAALNFKNPKFKHVEGALWFGDKSVTSSEGNIFLSNAVLNSISLNNPEAKVDKLYMESLIPNQPTFFKNFNFNTSDLQKNDPKKWAALLQPDGGSIDMESSYNYFHTYATTSDWGIKSKPVDIHDEVHIHAYAQETHTFIYYHQQKEKHAAGKKIFIACGVNTGDFVQDKMKGGDILVQESTLQEYVASYFKIEPGKESSFSPENFPTWIQFLNEQYTVGYGFPTHDWDNPINETCGKTIKIGTMAFDSLEPNMINTTPVSPTDHRVLKAKQYVANYMKNLISEPVANYRCPIVFYNQRETICDYLNRIDKDVVVHTGGWVGKYYPLLTASAFALLFKPDSLAGEQTRVKVQREFLNRTSYPIRERVKYLLSSPTGSNDEKPEYYDTVIVGAGCSGLYAAYRLLNDPNTANQKIGMFDMLNRIAGRLWSVKFKNSSSVMELGGMRYIEENHKLLTHYIKALHIPSLSFKMKGSVVQQYTLKAFLRNDHYRQDEWEQLQASNQKLITAYRLDSQVLGMTAFQIISLSAYKILMHDCNTQARAELNKFRGDKDYFDNHVKKVKKNGSKWIDYEFSLDLKDWNFLKPLLKYKRQVLKECQDEEQEKLKQLSKEEKIKQETASAKPLFKYGFQNIIENQFSHEAYSFVSEQNGYFSNTSNASYLEQVMTYLIDFGDVTYRTLEGGYDMICYTLVNEILQGSNPITKSGGGIYLQKQLTNIQEGDFGGYKYKLTFNIVSTKQNEPSNVMKCYANKIILGMPRRSIQILNNKIAILQKPISNYQPSTIENMKEAKVPKSLEDLLKSTQSMPSIKIIMNFSQNWWDVGNSKDPNLQSLRSTEQMRGVSCTDLPLRQALYFGTDSDNLLLASYNDMITTEFWSALQENFQDFVPTLPFVDHGNIANRKISKSKMKELYKQDLTDKRRRLQDFEKDLEKDSEKKKEKSNYFIMERDEDQTIKHASIETVKEVVRQLSLLHGKNVDICTVKEAMYQNWTIDPFGGGYHNWFSGWDVEAVMKAVRRPWKEQDIFIVGQAFSNLTGWVEGAFQTAERMLMKEYGLPATLPEQEYYIGY